MSFAIYVFVILIKFLLLPLIATVSIGKLSNSGGQYTNVRTDINAVSGILSTWLDTTRKQRIHVLKHEVELRKIGKDSLQINPKLFKFRPTKRTPIKPRQKVKTLRDIIRMAEERYGIPKNLLLSIAKVETGIRPYAVNYNGRGYVFNNISDAVNFAQSLINQGETNFSVGCFQLHYQSHRHRFKSLPEMFHPEKNVVYATNLLKKLYVQSNCNWKYAIKRYHSGYEVSNCIYYTKIVNNLGYSI